MRNPKLVQREIFEELKVPDSDPRETQEVRWGFVYTTTCNKVLRTEQKGFWNRMDRQKPVSL